MHSTFKAQVDGLSKRRRRGRIVSAPFFHVLAMALIACTGHPPIDTACTKYYACYRAQTAWDDGDCEYDFGSRSEACIQCVKGAVCVNPDAGTPPGEHDFASCAAQCPGLRL